MGFFTNLKAQRLTDEYFELVVNFWSWTTDDDVYNRFKSYAPSVKNKLYQSFIESIEFKRKVPNGCIAVQEDKDELYRAIAYSYYLVMGLQGAFSSRNLNYILNWMVEVFEEKGYFDATSGFDGINQMIKDVDDIVRATRRLEEWGDRRITFPDDYDGTSLIELKRKFVWGD
jgi:hypothetical protein